MRTCSASAHRADSVPNWIYNRLEVRGTPAAVARFMAAVREEPTAEDSEELAVLDFERVLPTPAELLGERSDSWAPIRRPDGDDAWMHWRNEHWGTKWNAIYPEILDGDAQLGHVAYKFRTAWSTPAEWLAEVSRLHASVELRHEHVDEMCEAAFRDLWVKGEITDRVDLDPWELEWIDYEE